MNMEWRMNIVTGTPYHSSINIPATKPEKKKFTHANVSVCGKKNRQSMLIWYRKHN
jgi:hypothetical protein